MLIAYHGKQETKDFYVTRMKAHQAADEIQHGFYWEDGKGCAVGCTIHSDQHKDYEKSLGVPMILARLEDRIFEGLSNGAAKEFPLRFLEAIKPGADLSMVWPKFAVWLLIDEKHGVARHTKKNSTQYVSIHAVADLYKRLIAGEDVKTQEWRAAAAAAAAAYAAAADAAAARQRKYIAMSEKLIEILSA